ncbi:hypothetical protein B0H34DRAFT_683221 [Crassisporium funariophilum]|nr:hypothetical protein B0H34DRAFT_683221 [Crassisporium funariophilum]
MSATTMHFGPEWMRTKHQPLSRPQAPPSPPPFPNSSSISGLSTYSALVSSTPPAFPERHDEVHPFRYSKDELLRIYQEGGGKGGLGLEVERWEGVVREIGGEPVTLREMTEAEKKLFAGPLNSDLRRRPSQSTDYLSPLNTSSIDRPRLTHTSPSATSSPLRDRFGALKRRDSATGPPDPAMLVIPRKPSLSTLQTVALSPRDAPARTRVGYTPSFDGVLNSGESWVARRRASEASMKLGNASGRDVIDNLQHTQGSGILEEKEGKNGSNLQLDHEGEGSYFPSSPNVVNERSRHHTPMGVASDKLNMANNHPHINKLPSSTVYGQERVEAGPPAGLVDLNAVEWSYKDPTGQIQGPFRADLMQKWYNDGYFASDLPMKRTRYDTHWTTVEDLAKRSNGDNIFLHASIAGVPPGLGRGNSSPLPTYPLAEYAFNEPYQPAPIRSLRASALDSYLSAGSLPSDSPSSSFGASQFGNSPDPSAFGGREDKHIYAADTSSNGRLSGFVAQDHPSAFVDRRTMSQDYASDSMNHQGHSYSNFTPERVNGHGFSNNYVPQDPWSMSSNHTATGFMVAQNQVGNSTFSVPSSNFVSSANLDQPQNHSDGPPIDSISRGCNQGIVYVNRNASDISVQPSGSTDLKPLHFNHHDSTGLTASFRAVQDHQQHPSPIREYTEVAQVNPFTFHGLPSNSIALETPGHVSDLPAMLTSSTKNASDLNVAQPAPMITTLPISSTAQSPWAYIGETSDLGAQLNTLSSQSKQSAALVGSVWKDEPSPSSLTTGNLGQHNQQQQELAESDRRNLASTSPQQKSPSQAPIDPVRASDPPVSSRPAPVKTSNKPVPVPLPITQSVAVDSLNTPIVQKTAWVKEEETKKRGSGVSPSLREIQEAEAKKAELRKAAEREKERSARASSAVSEVMKEDLQPFTTSWGLPTSQAGSRPSTGARELSVVQTPTVATTPVWTTPLKQPVAKKSMKEIQEEEERRKKLAAKEVSIAAPPKRAYADTMAKVSASPSLAVITNSAWTTVGANGKSSTLPSPIRPIVQTAISSQAGAASPSVARVAVTPLQRVTVNPALKTRPSATKQEDFPEAPSHDFLKWLSDSLKGLNNSVNVEEIMSMLLSFPLDPDPSTIEIISDTVYSNSTMLDGRRFASEFVAKRKADAATRPKGEATSAKSSAKPVSIADVVKANPKAAQPEWGFKVVNKKKKGGRS